MTQKIIVYIIVAVSFIYFIRWIYRFFRSSDSKNSSVQEKCKSCPEFRGSCSDSSISNCTDTDSTEPE
jgi:hypothetical protein